MSVIFLPQPNVPFWQKTNVICSNTHQPAKPPPFLQRPSTALALRHPFCINWLRLDYNTSIGNEWQRMVMGENGDHDKVPAFILQKNNQYSVACQIKRAADCLKTSEYYDSHEEAQERVEDECWIFSGEGWICFHCVESIWKKVVNKRQEKEDRWKGWRFGSWYWYREFLWAS